MANNKKSHKMEQLAAMFHQLGKAAAQLDKGSHYPVLGGEPTAEVTTRKRTDVWGQSETPPISRAV